MKLWMEKIHLDLKVNWKLSRNQTTFKENFIVHFETKLGIFRSEVAPNIRYGETPELIQSQFNQWHARNDFSLDTIDEMKLFHSLRFGIESVLLAYEAKKAGMDLYEYIDLKRPVLAMTSFSMPIMPVGEIRDYLKPIARFQSLKIKVDAESGADILAEIKKYTQVKLRVDANEGWRDFDQFMRFLKGLKGMNIELIEQPFPSSMQNEYIELKKVSPYKLLADESIEDVGDFELLSKQFHAVNIKLMKTGSLLRARDLILKAQVHGMESMMGCMIETSIGISYGMLFTGMVEYVDLDGFLLVKNEPFQVVQEELGILSLV